MALSKLQGGAGFQVSLTWGVSPLCPNDLPGFDVLPANNVLDTFDGLMWLLNDQVEGGVR